MLVLVLLLVVAAAAVVVLIGAFVVVVVFVVNVDLPHHQHLTRIFGVCNYWNNKTYQLNL